MRSSTFPLSCHLFSLYLCPSLHRTFLPLLVHLHNGGEPHTLTHPHLSHQPVCYLHTDTVSVPDSSLPKDLHSKTSLLSDHIPASHSRSDSQLLPLHCHS